MWAEIFQASAGWGYVEAAGRKAAIAELKLAFIVAA
jgi:hypothetical protein